MHLSIAAGAKSLYLTPRDVASGKIRELLTAPWFPTPSLAEIFPLGIFHWIYLLMLGPKVEREWGSKRFIRFYLVVAYLSTLAAFGLRLLSPALSIVPASTASAAIFGVVVAYAMLWPRDIFIVFGVLPTKVVYIVLFLCIFEGVFLIISGAGAYVDFVAEIIGIGICWMSFRIPAVASIVRGAPRSGSSGGMRRKSRGVGPIEMPPRFQKPGAPVDSPTEEKKKDRKNFLEL